MGCDVPSIVIDVSNGKVESNEFKTPSKNSKIDHWKVSPNPSSERITVESDWPFISVRISDLEGKMLEKRLSLQNIRKIEFNVSTYSKATYVLSVEFKNGTSDTKRIIIQR